MAVLIDGKAVASKIRAQVAERVARLCERGIVPCLATVLVGDDPASETYVRMKGNACERVGMVSRRITLPKDATQEQLMRTIRELNEDPAVHGILLQHPVPGHLDEREAFDAIAIDKDVDGVTTLGFGRAAFDLPGFRSCTPQAIIRLLDEYEIPIEGRRAVVVGRSPILGKPVAHLLLNRNATVTICHSRTQDLPQVVREADILVAAVGRPKFIQGEWVKEGVVVMDAGYNPGNIGDVDFDACVGKASAITPVPGGVGPVTIATLLENTVAAAEARVRGGKGEVTAREWKQPLDRREKRPCHVAQGLL